MRCTLCHVSEIDLEHVHMVLCDQSCHDGAHMVYIRHVITL